MTDRELMQRALDALRLCTALPTWPSITPVIEALRARLSKCDRCGEVNPAEIHTYTPKEQEPVGEVLDERGEVDWMSFVPPAGTSLYTSPPAQRKPLTSQERDAQRWRFLMENSYDSNRVTQFHVWEHSWNPHSQTGEPTEWKQRVRGIALIDFIDRAIEAAHGIKENKDE